jgi:hypothetical protein
MNRIINKLKIIARNVSNIFRIANSSAELKLDAFIFSKHVQPQIRALISGTGLHVTIPLDCLDDSRYFFERFSKFDQTLIESVISNTDLYSKLIESENTKLVAKNINKKTKRISLTVSIAKPNDECFVFEIDAAELSRNKFLLKLFNKEDAFNIGYSAAESRIRSEAVEINKLKDTNFNS